MNKEKEKAALMKAADEATVQIVKLIKEKKALDQRIAQLRMVILTRDEVLGRKTPIPTSYTPLLAKEKYGKLAMAVESVMNKDEWTTVGEISGRINLRYEIDFSYDSIRKALIRHSWSGRVERGARGQYKWVGKKEEGGGDIHEGDVVTVVTPFDEHSAVNPSEGG